MVDGKPQDRDPIADPVFDGITVILAAGMGSRLNKPWPKPLTPLPGDETIMARQLRLLRPLVDPEAIHLVVGHKHSTIMEAHPDLCYVYNELYDQTNTSKSLLRALRKAGDRPVLWLNGDVVLEAGVLDRILAAHDTTESEAVALASEVADEVNPATGHEAAPTAFIGVHYGPVGEEEVTFLRGEDGTMTAIAKNIPGGEGEAVGVNLVNATGVPLLKEALDRCGDDDYFERGLELAIEAGLHLVPVDVTDQLCIEVDFQEDLDKASDALRQRVPQ